MYKNKVFFIILLLAFSIQFVSSQNNTNSPLTRFGYGEINDNTSGSQRGMGGASIGLRQKDRINTVNPASYSSVDSLTFMFDLGATSLISRFSEASARKTSVNGNLEYITMQFRLFKGIGLSAGLMPYSFSGYDFHTIDSMQPSFDEKPKSVIYQSSFKGNGGFSQFYTGLSVDLFKHVSLGANLYYMFGTSNNMRTISYGNNEYASVNQVNSIAAGNIRLRYGAQFYHSFSNKHYLSLGAIYEPRTSFRAKAEQITVGDRESREDKSNAFELPQIFGTGLNYTFDNKLSLAFDYNFEQWANIKFFGVRGGLSNAMKLSLGGEYQPNSRSYKFAERLIYRGGIKFGQPYYKIPSVGASKNFGISFGLGIPLRSASRTMLNMAFEYVNANTTGALKEDYFKLTFNFTLTESWFYKQKL